MKLTKAQERQFKAAVNCSLCDKELGNDRVRDHDHLTGDYRGAAHNTCNTQYGWKNYNSCHIP